MAQGPKGPEDRSRQRDVLAEILVPRRSMPRLEPSVVTSKCSFIHSFLLYGVKPHRRNPRYKRDGQNSDKAVFADVCAKHQELLLNTLLSISLFHPFSRLALAVRGRSRWALRTRTPSLQASSVDTTHIDTMKIVHDPLELGICLRSWHKQTFSLQALPLLPSQ